MLVNLINITYCAMKLLPYQDKFFSEYRAESVQEFRFAISRQIQERVFCATFAKNIETHMKSNAIFFQIENIFVIFIIKPTFYIFEFKIKGLRTPIKHCYCHSFFLIIA